MKIEIPEYCIDCQFQMDTEDEDMYCSLFKEDLVRISDDDPSSHKCKKCLSGEPIEISYNNGGENARTE